MKERKPTRRRKPPEEPKGEVVVRRAVSPPAPFLIQLVDTLRVVAERMLDLADSAAEAITKRLPERS